MANYVLMRFPFACCFLVQVGNEERIHVYYVRGQENSTFARRCYQLLDEYVMVKLYVNL